MFPSASKIKLTVHTHCTWCYYLKVIFLQLYIIYYVDSSHGSLPSPLSLFENWPLDLFQVLDNSQSTVVLLDLTRQFTKRSKHTWIWTCPAGAPHDWGVDILSTSWPSPQARLPDVRNGLCPGERAHRAFPEASGDEGNL